MDMSNELAFFVEKFVDFVAHCPNNHTSPWRFCSETCCPVSWCHLSLRKVMRFRRRLLSMGTLLGCNTAHLGGYLGHGVSFVDFNEDGFDDLCFAQFEGQILAYEGDGEGGFASADLGMRQHGGRAQERSMGRFRQRWGSGSVHHSRLSVNRLYARMPDGSLAEVPGAGGMAGTDHERTYGAAVADFNKDGRLDVYLCHYHTPQTNSEENRLFSCFGRC